MKVVESLKTRGSIIHFEGFLNDFLYDFYQNQLFIQFFILYYWNLFLYFLTYWCSPI